MQLRGRQLHAGIAGADVAELQLALTSLGYAIPPNEREQEVFGLGTAAAVAQFQKANGLPETTIVEDETASTLGRVLGESGRRSVGPEPSLPARIPPVPPHIPPGKPPMEKPPIGPKPDSRLATVRRPLRVEVDELIAEMRARNPDGFSREPLAAGAVAPDVPLPEDLAAPLFRVAFAESAGVPATQDGAIVWVDGDDELLLRAAEARLVLRDGFALVAIGVYTVETGETTVVVPFAAGRPELPLGLIMATEPVPRGDPRVTERWGEQLGAAAWQALLHLAAAVAGAAGVDDEHHELLPGSLLTTGGGLAVTPQARHAFDRSAG